jgi:molybdate transport system substrate-binding protein
MRTGTLVRLAAATALMATLLGTAQPRAQDASLLVFAAASLKTALDRITTLWQAETGGKAVVSYAASSALAKQIEQGAPAQVFISADLAWMDYLQSKGLIDPDTRANLLSNDIVLIAPRAAGSGGRPAEIGPGFDWSRRLGQGLGKGRLAIANVDYVPAGRYAKAALEHLGAWNAVKDRLAQAENVRAALRLVARGEAPMGVVYATDAAAEPDVVIIATFPRQSYPPIVYPAALTRRATRADAARFLAFLQSETARGVFRSQGFAVLDPLRR